jgi:hypothetical protein
MQTTGQNINASLDKYVKLTPQRFIKKLYNKVLRVIRPGFTAKMAPDSRRVLLPRIETYLANGCNLKCHLCSHFNPKRKGVTETDHLKQWMDTWKEKILPNTVALLGGEPLLNKSIAEIVQHVKRCWKKARIEIVTNGILIKNLSDSDLDAIKEVNGYFVISQHTSDAGLIAKIIEGIQRLEEKKIRFEVRPSIREWLNYHRIGQNGEPLPYQSHPQIAWQHCIPKECVALWDNNIYLCSILANVRQAWKEGVIGDEWKRALDYKPLTPESTASEIIAHLNVKSVPECCICPEKYDLVRLPKTD